MQNRIKILTLNVRGLGQESKRLLIFDYIRQTGADIILLQETHSSVSVEDQWTAEWNSKAKWNSMTCTTAGTAILLANNRISIVDTTGDMEGRMQQATIKLGKTKLNITNIHAHNNRKRRKAQLRTLAVRTKKFREHIVAGDFNGVDSPEMDREPPNISNDNADARYSSYIMETSGVTDVFRTVNGNQREFTFFYAKGKSRIDRIYASSGIKPLTCKHIPCPFSDHDAALATIQMPGEQTRTNNVWKNNTMLYETEEYQKALQEKWGRWETLHPALYETKVEWWKAVKRRLKLFNIAQAKKAAKTRKRRLKEAEKELTEVRSNVIENKTPQSEYRKAKRKIWMEKSENMNKLKLEAKAEEENLLHRKPYILCERVKKQQEAVTIEKLNDETGQPVTDQEEIRKIVENFYRKLYSKPESDKQTVKYFLRHQKGRLTEAQRNKIDAPIKVEEVRLAVIQQRVNRTPGEDGISSEFYKKFIDTIDIKLTETLNEMYFFQKAEGEMANGIIKTLFKKGDPADIRNYRPITLLNVDYKILSKILANRVKCVLPDITHQHQHVNPPNKIDQLNLLLRETAAEMKRRNRGAMVSIDFQKAYDTVSHEFLKDALEEVGFGINFRRFFGTIYEQGKAKISVNGQIGNNIKIEGGIKQGDPVSMYLFTILTDSLLQTLNDSIAGFRLTGMKRPLTTPAYADDITVTMAGEVDAEKAINIIGEFGKASGLRINHQKTSGISFERKQRKGHQSKIKWVSEIEILGNIITHRDRHTTTKWMEAMRKASRLLEDMESMYLKRYEKNAILRTNVLPLFTYAAATSKMPGKVRSRIKVEITKFLFGVDPKIDYARITLPKEQGGLGTIDIITMADLAYTKPVVEFLRRANGNPEENWNRRLEHQLAIILTRYRQHEINNALPHTSQPLEHWTAAKERLEGMKYEKEDSKKNPKERYQITLARTRKREAGEMVGPCWENIHSECLTYQQKQFNWEVAHRLLRTNERLQTQMATTTRNCVLCGVRIETHEHIFATCKCTKNVLNLVIDSWEKATERKLEKRDFQLLLEMAIGIVLTSEQKHALLILISTYKQAVWRGRNIKKYEKRPIDEKWIVTSLQQRLRMRYRRDPDGQMETILKKAQEEIRELARKM